ncbi:MAG TPA: 2-C-methyl-D-erythritol 2,4-cyclodiphosphate synthase [Candidatus Omnitrophota bacterium]|nr:2-C-methyl-D-erythritol 2,4-cyclodiphosphate synthase [Candidatus Omnitrophota bacterium]HPT39506.1 2-C-methyl-D-erythritol 2,4-cyclodiphosphate synthase [Candidatus Omnitrophota bacterium]
MRYKIGIGYDIHRLVEGRKLLLGAVEIPYSKGLLGHSDGDALIHALCDAILGALAFGDIGEHFPDTDPKYKDIASSQLLTMVKEFLDDSGYKINNLDVIIIAQEPKLLLYKKQMRENICELLGIRRDLLNIKAKTNEGLGELGRCEAIACYVTASLIKGE